MFATSVLDRFKGFWQGVVLQPFVKLFIRLGISPDAVTVVGTIGVSAGALIFFPQGMLWQGVLVIVAFVFSDLIDGQMARTLGRKDTFGAFLDSTLDRVADSAIFAGLVLYFAWVAEDRLYVSLALVCLVMGSVTSGSNPFEGMPFFGDLLNLPILYEVTLWLLAIASTVTVLQRILLVRRQAFAAVAPQDPSQP